MRHAHPLVAAAPRLRVSPAFVLAFAMDGRPYVATEVEPYVQYWLSERDRVLHGLFARRGGATEAEALEDYCTLTRTPRTARALDRLRAAVGEMREAGVLIGARDDVSRYDARIVRDYIAHRPFPQPVADLLVRRATIGRTTRVLDLAGGPGDLALALAAVSDHVSLMDLSRGFLQAATRRARQLGRPLTPLHDSCNRLAYRDDDYDVITISQALHWLDDVLVARGVRRLLRARGSFFVIHSAMEVHDQHPLASVVGRHSVFGAQAALPFATEVTRLGDRLARLFDALDAPDVHRLAPARPRTGHARPAGHAAPAAHAAPGRPASRRIAPAGVTIFRQPRPFDLGYVRGFLTDTHITSVGRDPSAFWRDLESRVTGARHDDLLGVHHWAVLHFRRGSTRQRAGLPVAPIDIAFAPAGTGRARARRHASRPASAGER